MREEGLGVGREERVERGGEEVRGEGVRRGELVRDRRRELAEAQRRPEA